MRKPRPCSIRNVSPTVQFGTAVRKPAGSCTSPVRVGEEGLEHGAIVARGLRSVEMSVSDLDVVSGSPRLELVGRITASC
jgi:hypothetical protein